MSGGSDSLWPWVLTAYARPGVAETCLELQDSAGQNVPLLLWTAWTAATGRALDEDTRDAACDTARVWEETVIAPLRAVRRALKIKAVDMDDDDREAVRSQVKAAELDAERRLLLALEALSPSPSGPARPAIDALVAVARIWSSSIPRPGLVHLAERLPA
ncbi:TIGR02444 family protein [Brevundimonas sp.]|uniref:TIGR02444 family protein n=1 Tax=Brevundimonas sp. TaxID=1871086 RepID=UPI0035B4AE2B